MSQIKLKENLLESSERLVEKKSARVDKLKLKVYKFIDSADKDKANIQSELTSLKQFQKSYNEGTRNELKLLKNKLKDSEAKITFFEKRKKADKEKREEMLKQFMDREELLNKRIKELESNDPNFKVKKLKVDKEEDIVKLELLKKENELEETKKDSYK